MLVELKGQDGHVIVRVTRQESLDDDAVVGGRVGVGRVEIADVRLGLDRVLFELVALPDLVSLAALPGLVILVALVEVMVRVRASELRLMVGFGVDGPAPSELSSEKRIFLLLLRPLLVA